MSETKTPKAGEWWLRNSGGRIFFIVGFDPDGCPVHWNEDVGFFSSKMRFFCREFRHEPRCTGFGWVEPTAETFRTIDVNPGEGYRWLEDDEIVTPTDEVFRPDMSPCWVTPLTRAGYTVAYRGDDDYPVRRSIARTQPVEPPAIDSNDIPLNPVPGKVVATGTVTFTPVESPDDWVNITETHSEHILRGEGIDQCKNTGSDVWAAVVGLIGESIKSVRYAYKIRCRRKDLPGAVPATVYDPETFTSDWGPFEHKGDRVPDEKGEFYYASFSECLMVAESKVAPFSDRVREEAARQLRELAYKLEHPEDKNAESPDNMAAIIAEHTQQVRELTQRIGELAQQVNERDAVIEKILPHCRPDCSV